MKCVGKFVDVIRMKRYFKIVMEKDEDGVYIATVPELPGCVSDGKTKGEALKNVKEAITGYLETLKDEGWYLPKIVSIDRVAVEVNAQIA
jgi:predicted RNase H-like HicB family nuclease